MDMTAQCGNDGKPPDSPERRWKIRQLVYGETLMALDAVFADLVIEYMPMKGAHLICTGLAESLDAREMRDIDLLVRPVDFTKTLAALENHPQFTRERPDLWDFEQSFLFRYDNHSVHFELHRALNRPERFLLDTDELFDRAVAGTAMRRIMSAEDALVVLVCHILVHIVEGIPEHVFGEVTILSRVEGFSWERFEAILRTTGIARFGRAFLTKAAQIGGVELPKTLHAKRWESALLTIRTPYRRGVKTMLFRGGGVKTMLFRGGVELLFVRDPLGMLSGYLRGWRTIRA